VQVINKGENLDLDLSQLTYDVALGDDIIGSGTTAQVVKINPQSEITVILPLLLKVEKPLKTSLQVLFDNDKMNYTLHLRGLLSTKKIKEIPVDFTATGITELVK
jgi:LEA14-like dessication related protein